MGVFACIDVVVAFGPRRRSYVGYLSDSLGNIETYPESTDYDNYDSFFDQLNGGDPSQGYDTNPVTGEAYEQQVVPRGDYTRVLAEFWADGPDSETPPGHWFTILNTVNDHPSWIADSVESDLSWTSLSGM